MKRVLVTTLVSECSAVIHKRVLVTTLVSECSAVIHKTVLVTTLVSNCSAVIHKTVLVTVPQRFAVTGCMSCTVYSHIAHWEVSYDFCIIHHLGTGILKSKQYLTGLPGDTYHRPLWILMNCP